MEMRFQQSPKCYAWVVLIVIMSSLSGLCWAADEGTSIGGTARDWSEPGFFVPFQSALSATPRLRSIAVGPDWDEIRLRVEHLSQHVRQQAWGLGLSDGDVVGLLRSRDNQVFLKLEDQLVLRIQ